MSTQRCDTAGQMLEAGLQNGWPDIRYVWGPIGMWMMVSCRAFIPLQLPVSASPSMQTITRACSASWRADAAGVTQPEVWTCCTGAGMPPAGLSAAACADAAALRSRVPSLDFRVPNACAAMSARTSPQLLSRKRPLDGAREPFGLMLQAT